MSVLAGFETSVGCLDGLEQLFGLPFGPITCCQVGIGALYFVHNMVGIGQGHGGHK